MSTPMSESGKQLKSLIQHSKLNLGFFRAQPTYAELIEIQTDFHFPYADI